MARLLSMSRSTTAAGWSTTFNGRHANPSRRFVQGRYRQQQPRRRAPPHRPTTDLPSRRHCAPCNSAAPTKRTTEREQPMLASLRSAFSTTGSSTEPLGIFGLGSDKESPSDQFASWLPYQSYLEDEQLFVNHDGIGF